MSAGEKQVNACRILDDEELEGLQWRKNVEDLRINRIFGSDSKVPSPFQKEKPVVFSYHTKRHQNFPKIPKESRGQNNQPQ